METSYFTTHNNWHDQIQELASQYEMKREEMEVIVNDIQHQEQTLEWLTQPRVQNIVKHRKGRWTQVIEITVCSDLFYFFDSSVKISISILTIIGGRTVL